MPHPDFAKVAEFIAPDHVRDTLAAMVDIASPTGRELGMAQFLVERMRRIGLDADLQFVNENRPNTVGHLRGRGSGLNPLFTGHMASYSSEEPHLTGPGFKPKAVYKDGWMGPRRQQHEERPRRGSSACSASSSIRGTLVHKHLIF